MSHQQVMPGVYQLTRGANIFILETAPDELTLIDTGIPGSTRLVLNAIQSLGKNAQHIKQILITHADIDHVGSLAGLVAESGAKVYASPQSEQYIQTRTTPPHLSVPFNWLAGTAQRFFQKNAAVDHLVKHGEILGITAGGIEALAIPGHTPDNFGYYWRQMRVLFVPDLLNTQNGMLRLTQAPITWDMTEAKRSARKVLDIKPKIICVGHGDPVNLAQYPEAVTILEKALTGSLPLAAT